MSNKSGVAEQVLRLPKGGGAVKGIGETFHPNLFTGTANHSIPIAISPGRNGFGPALSLEYSSGSGNGPFGLGWELAIPRITRKTEKGLPRYDDADVFLLTGTEDLVPLREKVVDSGGQEHWQLTPPMNRPPYVVYRYRPRTEGLFARIERWENTATQEVHWRTISSDNVTSIFGRTAASRLADPESERRVYEWLLNETFDGFGNHVVYQYARDNPRIYLPDSGLSSIDIFEGNRNATQLYVRRICYGNIPSPLVDSAGRAVTYADGSEVGRLCGGRRYAFEVVFDYGDWDIPTKEPHPESPDPGEQELFGLDPSASSIENPVPIRTDRFSSFRAGFEVRTLRRCRRALMFHHFAELGGPTLVRSTDFEYHIDPDTATSFLSAVTVNAYRREAGSYRSASMPPVMFSYSEFQPDAQRYQSVRAEADNMPPWALNNPNVTLVDLFGEGLPDVLHSGPEGFRYWKNRGGGVLDRPRPMRDMPAGLSLAQPGVAFGDMGGDGRADLLVQSGPIGGFFETSARGTWQKFVAFEAAPLFQLGNPDVRLLDLTGNGLSDALLTDDDRFIWFECLGERGFAAPRYIPRTHDLDLFPDIFFSDSRGRVRLADMSGDGLTDIVLVHNGRIDYWPNRGYGRFGRRITMANAPRLDADFNPRQLFLADLNGDGCTDLVYVDVDRVHFWFNQAGNRWSDTRTITGTPTLTDVDSIQFADVFGHGTATLLWTYDRSDRRRDNYKALDFCGGVKPYVLTEVSNNMGATTRVSYAPSIRYLLEDQANGTPWITKLPFPVQVVDKVEVIDRISKVKLVTTYRYHHGYFDGREREFRGFGRVDCFDTEVFEEFTGSSLHDSGTSFSNSSREYHVPPIESRTWFHTGVYFDAGQVGDTSGPFDHWTLMEEFRKEFYGGDSETAALPPHDIEGVDTPHEAYRVLRGALLRTEVYAHDGSSKAEHPYEVTEVRYRVARLQPGEGHRHAVYRRHSLETLSCQYERNPLDPRVAHTLTLEEDAFGNPLRSLAIAYGRRQPDPTLPTQADRDTQTRTLITYTESGYTNAVDDPALAPDHHRTPLPSEVRSYELTGFTPAGRAIRFSFDEWAAKNFARLNEAAEINHEEAPTWNEEQKRLLEHVRTRYRRDDLSDLLHPGALESLALAGENRTLAFTRALVADAYGDRVTDDMLAAAGYVHSEGDVHWWIPSGQAFYSPHVTDTAADELRFARQHFFSTRRSLDAFGNTTVVAYDAYNLLVTEMTDPVGNRTTAEHDYRLLQTFRITDANGNRSEVAFDTLGLVIATAAMGKVTEGVGDSLVDFRPEVTQEQLEAFISHPRRPSASSGESEAAPVVHELLQNATTRIIYDIHRYVRTGEPVFAATLARETHTSAPLPPAGLRVQVSFSYSDGFGREIQRKIQAEPGPVDEGAPSANPRWVGSGWTIFNNKGKPVKQYEPFFSGSHAFEFDRRAGVGPVLFCDPIGRVTATLHPNHTWQKVVFDAWRQETWDLNDTVLIADPTADQTAGDFFRRLPKAAYLPGWHSLRTDANLEGQAIERWPDPRVRRAERRAAQKASVHAGTPAVSHQDALGRSFLTVTHNRFRYGDVSSGDPPTEEFYTARAILDIKGRTRQLVDANSRVFVRYHYDMLGGCIHQVSMDAGERWTLNDVVGQPVYAWDDRDHRFRTAYDALRRPVEIVLRIGDGRELLIERTVYGDTLPDAERTNQRGRVVQLFDQAGVVVSQRFDFKGNLLASERRLAAEYKSLIDWWSNPPVQSETFSSVTAYDALDRPASVHTADRSVYRPTFNEANMLERVDLDVRAVTPPQPIVTAASYDAKGQRMQIRHANGVTTDYEYDPVTFRLVRLRTGRDGTQLQDLTYTYDAAGNITQIRDDAQQAVYFDNAVVEPGSEYTYDALYRLIEATGREHVGQHSSPETSWNDDHRTRLAHPQDGRAMRRYTERYEYDPANNIRAVIHRAADANWTRSYTYDEPSLTEPEKKNNRLTRTTVGAAPAGTETYSYDAHGNTTRMAHLPGMAWSFRDRLERAELAGGGTAYYVYDASGERVRKIVEKNGGSLVEERISIGAFELFQRRGSGGAVILERETLHVVDDRKRVALIETRTRGSDGSPQQVIRYQASNHLGSASLELDEHAQIVSYEEYYPYGSTSYQAVRNQAETAKRYRYAAMERDEETGLGYHSARYYAVWLGKWISGDPGGVSDGSNLYAYCHDSPIRLLDVSGADSVDMQIMQWSDVLGKAFKHVGQNPVLPQFKGMGDAMHSVSEGIARRYGAGLAAALAIPATPLVTVNDKPAVTTAHLLQTAPEQLFSNVYAQLARPALPFLQRTMAAVEAVGHAGEALGGAAACTTIVGCFVGAPAMAHGLDNFYSTSRFAITGDYVKPYTVSALEGLGFSESTASDVNSGMSFVLGGAAGVAAMEREAAVTTSLRLSPVTTSTPAPITPQPLPRIQIRYNAVMASSPSDAQFLRFNAEWALQSRGFLTVGVRNAADSRLRRWARGWMDRNGFSRTGRAAMHPLDSAINPWVQSGTPGRTYYFGSATVNSSFGGQLGSQFQRLNLRRGDDFTIDFVGFPSYDTVRPMAPVASPPNR